MSPLWIGTSWKMTKTLAEGRAWAEVERAEARLAQRRAAVPAVSYPPELPVSQAVDELKEVSGIGDARFATLRDLVTV